MASMDGPGFSVPFVGTGERQAMVPVDEVVSCYMEADEHLWRMEDEISRAVAVTITGTRPEVDLASMTAALHDEFGIGLNDMSIRPLYPEDLLMLCENKFIRDLLVDQGHASSTWFSLSLQPC